MTQVIFEVYALRLVKLYRSLFTVSLASDIVWLRQRKALFDEKVELYRNLAEADGKLAEEGDVQRKMHIVREGDAVSLRRIAEDIQKEKMQYEDTVVKIRGDIVDLGVMSAEDVSYKDAAIRGSDNAQTKCRDGEGQIVRAQTERDRAAEECDRDIDEWGREEEQCSGISVNNANFIKDVTDNQVFYGKCALTINHLGLSRGNID